jgi:diaminopimelate epimerase
MEHERPKLRFTKAEGAQNDFLIVDDRDNLLSDAQRSAFAVSSCHRRRSVGGDGVIFIVPSDDNDFRMEFYNPDGSHGSMCGNGGRTAALWAYVHGIAPVSMHFDVLGKTYQAEIFEESVRLYFPSPQGIVTGMKIEDGNGELTVHFADTGAPHAVVLLEELRECWNTGAIFGRGIVHPAGVRAAGADAALVESLVGAELDALDVRAIGSLIRHHQRFQPVGANVNFIDFKSDGTIVVRTFEKGVEAETEACGTGNIASAIIAHILRGIPPPITLRTHGGDLLHVGFEPPPVMQLRDGECAIDPAMFASNLYLEGPAKMVYEGEIAMPYEENTRLRVM